MSSLIAFLVLAQSTDPVAWVIAPHVSAMQARAMASAWRTGFADATVKAAEGDSAVEAYYANGGQQTFITASDKAPYISNPSSVQAASIAPNADVSFVVRVRQVVTVLGMHPSAASWMRSLGLDALHDLVGGVTLTAPDQVHIEGLAGYPAAHAGFTEALGPAVAAVVPTNVPSSAGNVACISVRPAAVFAHVSAGFAEAAPMQQALFLTHLRGLESQLGKRFAEDALGPTPRIWAAYRHDDAVVGMLSVADVSLVKRFVASYADALIALMPGTQVAKATIAGREALLVTLPSSATFAIAYDTSAVIVATTRQALVTHFASKGRASGKASGSAIAFGTGVDVTQQIVPDAYTSHHDTAVWSIALTDRGFRVTADVRAKR